MTGQPAGIAGERPKQQEPAATQEGEHGEQMGDQEAGEFFQRPRPGSIG